MKRAELWTGKRPVVATRRLRRVVNTVAAMAVSAVLPGVLGFGYGTIPALSPALDPARLSRRAPTWERGSSRSSSASPPGSRRRE